MLDLGAAVRSKVFAYKAFLAVIGNRANQDDGGALRVDLSSGTEPIALNGRYDEDIYRDMRALITSKKREDMLDTAERGFIDRASLNHIPQNAFLTVNVFAPKKGLDSETLRWVLSHIDDQIKHSSSEVKLYWEMVRRVVVARNAPPPSVGSRLSTQTNAEPKLP
jgi:hypothetical protein